jgi:hypothetical protein
MGGTDADPILFRSQLKLWKRLRVINTGVIQWLLSRTLVMRPRVR